MQCSAGLYCGVKIITMQSNEVQCSTVQCIIVQFSAVHYSTLKYIAVYYSGEVKFHAMQSDVV